MALCGGCAAQEDYPIFVASQRYLGPSPPEGSHEGRGKQQKKLYEDGVKREEHLEMKADGDGGCEESKVEEKTTEAGDGTAMMNYKEVVEEGDEDRRNQEEAEEDYDNYDPNVYQDSEGDGITPRFIYTQMDSPEGYSGSYSPGSSVRSSTRWESAEFNSPAAATTSDDEVARSLCKEEDLTEENRVNQAKEGPEDETKDMPLDSIKLEELEVACVRCEHQTREQAG